jgi:hypothetical protein
VVNPIIREARVSDAASIARVHIESTEDAYAPLAKVWPAPDEEAKRAHWAAWLADNQRDARHVDLVAELGGDVLAFVGAGPARRDRPSARQCKANVRHILQYDSYAHHRATRRRECVGRTDP